MTPETTASRQETTEGVDVNTGGTTGNATISDKDGVTSAAPSVSSSSVTFTQADLNRILKDERGKWEQRLTTKLTEQQAETERQKAEAALLAKGDYETLKADYEKRLKTFEAKVKETERQALMSRVALKYQLSPLLASRLIGNTEEELEEDAKRVREEAEKLGPPVAPNTETGRAGAVKSGPIDMDELKRRKAAASGGVYSGI